MNDLYEWLAEAGVQRVLVDYNGSNDEGYIGEITFEPPINLDHNLNNFDFDNVVERAAYDVLEDKFPGWEINEGSEGTITIDVKNRRTSIHHGERIETLRYSDVEV